MTASTRDSQFDVYAASLVKSLTHVVKVKPDLCDHHLKEFSVRRIIIIVLYVLLESL